MIDLPVPTFPIAALRSVKAPRPTSHRPLASLPGGAALASLDSSDGEPTRLIVAWARDEDEVRLAQRLRFRVFADEMGARLKPLPGTPPGHDADIYDAFCEHLLVRVESDDGSPGRVVGTYRALTPDAARRAGGLYSDNEFDLTRLRSLRPRMIELGRSCVDPEWRSGGVILALWSALAQFMATNRLDTMIGCASVSMRDGGHFAASVWRRLSERHSAAEQWAVRPRLPLPVADLRCDLAVEPPPLIKGYVRCGARILGAPAWDPDFNTADLPMMLRFADLASRYRKHFLGA